MAAQKMQKFQLFVENHLFEQEESQFLLWPGKCNCIRTYFKLFPLYRIYTPEHSSKIHGLPKYDQKIRGKNLGSLKIVQLTVPLNYGIYILFIRLSFCSHAEMLRKCFGGRMWIWSQLSGTFFIKMWLLLGSGISKSTAFAFFFFGTGNVLFLL